MASPMGSQMVLRMIREVHGPNSPVVQIRPPVIDPFRECCVDCIRPWIFGEAVTEGGRASLFVRPPRSHLAFFGAVSYQAWREQDSEQMSEKVLGRPTGSDHKS